MSDYEIQSAFLDKKILRSKEHSKVFRKCIPGQRIEAASFWQCERYDGEIVSSGICVYRKGLTDEGKRIVAILKIKKKGATLTVDGLENSDEHFADLYTLISQNVKL